MNAEKLARAVLDAGGMEMNMYPHAARVRIIAAAQAAVAAARAEGMREAARFCDEWLASFGTVEIKHTPAREHACDAVADLRDRMIAEASK